MEFDFSSQILWQLRIQSNTSDFIQIDFCNFILNLQYEYYSKLQFLILQKLTPVENSFTSVNLAETRPTLITYLGYLP